MSVKNDSQKSALAGAGHLFDRVISILRGSARECGSRGQREYGAGVLAYRTGDC